jgi:hypothetical protein
MIRTEYDAGSRPFRRLLPVLPILLLFPATLGAQETGAGESSDTVEAIVDSLAADTVAVDTVQVRIEQAVAGLERLDLLVDSIVSLDNRTRRASRDERQVANMLGNQLIDEVRTIQGDLLRMIPRLEAAGQPVDSIKDAFGAFLYRVADLYEEALERRIDSVDDMRDRRAETPPDSLDLLELRIVEAKAKLDTLIAGQMVALANADSLGVDTAEQWEVVDRHLKNWAESQVGRLQIARRTERSARPPTAGFRESSPRLHRRRTCCNSAGTRTPPIARSSSGPPGTSRPTSWTPRSSSGWRGISAGGCGRGSRTMGPTSWSSSSSSSDSSFCSGSPSGCSGGLSGSSGWFGSRT